MGSLWFLWSLLYCILFTITLRSFFRDSFLCYIAFGILFFFIPDNILLTSYTKFMYPFFIFGYFVAKYQKILLAKKCYRWWCVILSFILWIILVSFYNRDSFIYTTGISYNHSNVIKQALIDIYRYAVGFCGCFWVIGICYWLSNKTFPICFLQTLRNLVERWGKKSLGIYVFQVYFFMIITKIICSKKLEFNSLLSHKKSR